MSLSARYALLVSLSVGFGSLAQAANQTATTTPVIVGGDLPYALDVQTYDMGGVEVPTLHSFIAGEHEGQWVIVAGLTNGLHGFDIDQSTIPERKQNRNVWVIDPVSKTTWSRTIDPADAGSGLTEAQVLSITSANAQQTQLGDRLYMTGGYGDDDPLDETSRSTFANLTAFDLPGLVDWAKGGAGQAVDHIRQISDPLFKVTGGDMYAIGDEVHLVFGQDYEGRYRGSLNGEYTKQVRTFTIQDDGASLGFTEVGSSTPEDHFRRRDLNVYPTIVPNGGTLEHGITVLSGVFTESRGAWTVPVEIDSSGQPVQIDGGADPMNTDGGLDADAGVFKQGMNNYHSAKVGLFSESTGEMHEVLFGGITLQEYDPSNPAADEFGFVTDQALPNTNQITSVVRAEDGSYEQHYLGEFPDLRTPTDQRMRFGSNAHFFPDEELGAYENGVLEFDSLAAHADPDGRVRIGWIYGGLIANAPHVFGNPVGLSSASGEVFEVFLTVVPEPTSLALCLGLAGSLGVSLRRRG